MHSLCTVLYHRIYRYKVSPCLHLDLENKRSSIESETDIEISDEEDA